MTCGGSRRVAAFERVCPDSPATRADCAQVAFRRYRVVDIDCNRNCFTAVFSLHMKWHDPSLTDREFDANNSWHSTWQPKWTPHFDFLNETGAPLPHCHTPPYVPVVCWLVGGIAVLPCVPAGAFGCGVRLVVGAHVVAVVVVDRVAWSVALSPRGL